MSSRTQTSPQSNLEIHAGLTSSQPITVGTTAGTEWIDTKDYAYAVLWAVSNGTSATWTSATLQVYENDVASDTGQSTISGTSQALSTKLFVRGGVIRLRGRKRYIKASFVANNTAIVSLALILHGPAQSITPGDSPIHPGATDRGYDFEV